MRNLWLLSISGKPSGQSVNKGKEYMSTAQADFRHDYDQGYIAIVMYSEKIARYAIYSWVGSWHYGIMIRGNSLKILAYLIKAIC